MSKVLHNSTLQFNRTLSTEVIKVNAMLASIDVLCIYCWELLVCEKINVFQCQQ